MHSHKGYSVLLGLIIHTFFDGIAIASGFLVSKALGWIIFFAIFLHKIPEGFTVSSVMLASGRSRGTAWGASVILGGATLAGVLTMAIFRQHVDAGLPLAAGVTIYVAASDLVPEVNKEPGARMALLVFVGAGVVFLLDALFHGH
jgi:ZIP family zinc transporter/zinc and cadmium transporter